MPDFRAKMHQKSIYSAPPDPLAGFKGPTSKGKEGRGRREGDGKGERIVRGGRRKIYMGLLLRGRGGERKSGRVRKGRREGEGKGRERKEGKGEGKRLARPLA